MLKRHSDSSRMIFTMHYSFSSSSSIPSAFKQKPRRRSRPRPARARAHASMCTSADPAEGAGVRPPSVLPFPAHATKCEKISSKSRPTSVKLRNVDLIDGEYPITLILTNRHLATLERLASKRHGKHFQSCLSWRKREERLFKLRLL